MISAFQELVCLLGVWVLFYPLGKYCNLWLELIPPCNFLHDSPLANRLWGYMVDLKYTIRAYMTTSHVLVKGIAMRDHRGVSEKVSGGVPTNGSIFSKLPVIWTVCSSWINYPYINVYYEKEKFWGGKNIASPPPPWHPDYYKIWHDLASKSLWWVMLKMIKQTKIIT